MDDPIVFLDIAIGARPIGRIEIALDVAAAPKTCENFRALCVGERASPSTRKPLHYASSVVHRVIPGFMIQGGDFVNGDGTGCASIYGSKFDDEAFVGRHTGAGLLSSANSGPDTNGCQFFVTCAKTEWLDDKHVVFGRVLGDGMLVIRKVENVATGGGNKPKLPCVIAECGEM